jgi:hypothetical protein
LPSSHDLLPNPPGKLSWKNTVYRAVNQYWENKLKEEAYTKITLKYLNIGNKEDTYGMGSSLDMKLCQYQKP